MKNTYTTEETAPIESQSDLVSLYGPGFSALQKWGGYKIGEGLGRVNQGIKTPIDFVPSTQNTENKKPAKNK